MEVKEADMGNIKEARTRTVPVLVAFEVELQLSCSMENHNICTVYFTVENPWKCVRYPMPFDTYAICIYSVAWWKNMNQSMATIII